jgi:hypothetical protein
LYHTEGLFSRKHVGLYGSSNPRSRTTSHPRQQDAEKLVDRGSPCTGLHGRPEPGRSVRQAHAKAWSHHEARRGQGSGIRDQERTFYRLAPRDSFKTLVTFTPCAFGLAPLAELWRSGPACRAVVQGSAGLPTDQRVKRRLQMHLASPTSPAHVGSLLRHHEKEFFSNLLGDREVF